VRVLLVDKLPELVRNRLAAAGFEVRSEPTAGGDTLIAAMREAAPDVLVVRSTKVKAAQLDAAPSLTLVVRAGAGVDNIDLAECSRRGIYVSNCPGKNGVAVAELAMGLIVALDRHIPDAVADLRAGKWNKKKCGVARGLKGRVLGILGVGTIGAEVALRARAFGMEVVGWETYNPAAAEAVGVRLLPTPRDVAAACDVLTVHLASSDATRGIVNADVLGALKPGASFVNTARGDLVDEDALVRAMDERGIRAGLDVFSDEPAAAEGPCPIRLASHPNVYGTHHVGASTDQAQEAVAEETVRIVIAYRTTGAVPNCVNLARGTGADHLLVVRHRDRVGVLAAILGLLREDGINVEEMENIIFDGGEAACARIQVRGAPGEPTLARMRSHEHVFTAAVVRIDGG
jgi:D-3-phosphoglycerate dehydrogenase